MGRKFVLPRSRKKKVEPTAAIADGVFPVSRYPNEEQQRMRERVDHIVEQLRQQLKNTWPHDVCRIVLHWSLDGRECRIVWMVDSVFGAARRAIEEEPE